MSEILTVLQTALSVIGAAAALAAALPKANEELGKTYEIVRKFLDLFGFNFGNAKNEVR